jgi:hypothetical protein
VKSETGVIDRPGAVRGDCLRKVALPEIPSPRPDNSENL